MAGNCKILRQHFQRIKEHIVPCSECGVIEVKPMGSLAAQFWYR